MNRLKLHFKPDELWTRKFCHIPFLFMDFNTGKVFFNIVATAIAIIIHSKNNPLPVSNCFKTMWLWHQVFKNRPCSERKTGFFFPWTRYFLKVSLAYRVKAYNTKSIKPSPQASIQAPFLFPPKTEKLSKPPPHTITTKRTTLQSFKSEVIHYFF